jgi:citrate lyase subunit beta/citryl-CoA lyase
LVFDLEDAISPENKSDARARLAKLLETLPDGKPVFVRVNAVSSPWFTGDIEACALRRISGFLIPKVSSRADIIFADRLLRIIENAGRECACEPGKFKLMPLIETAQGIVNINDILNASKRIIAAAFGAYDYRSDMRIMASASSEFQWAPRALLAIAARAAGLLPIDTPYFSVKDMHGLEKEKREAAGLGYAGSLIITPRHATICNKCFSPGAKDIEYSHGVFAAIERAEREGLGVALHNGLMIDAPIKELAEYIRDYEQHINGGLQQ